MPFPPEGFNDNAPVFCHARLKTGASCVQKAEPSSRGLRQHLFHQRNDLLESGWVVDGHVGQDLAV